jgi:D-alanine-D-alanine ligase
MTEGSSYFPKACEIDGGYTYDKVVSLLLEKGLSRASSRVAVPDDVIEGASASIMI